MGVTPIGSLTQYQAGTGASGNTSITVPSDAEIIVIAVHGYGSDTNCFTGGSMSVGGNTCGLEVAGDGDNAFFKGALFVGDVRTTRGTQTLAWSWLNTLLNLNDARLVYRFYKGVNVSNFPTSAYRHTNAAQAMSDPFSVSATAQSSDRVIAWSWMYDAGQMAVSWTNATTVADFLWVYGSATGSWAEGTPSGTVTVTADWSVSTDGGICTLTLIAARSHIWPARPLMLWTPS